VPAVRKLWHLVPNDAAAADRLAREARTTSVVAQLLLNRGIATAEAARLFLDSPLNALHAPESLPGVPAAADRIARAVLDGKKICIYGDYDVDGTTGTAILLGLLDLLGAKAEFYVPNRAEEGYGLNVEAVRLLAKCGIELLVTVDCGIASVAEAEEAQRLGLALIITDHHEMGERLPPADVLVHPRLPGSTYPHAGLSGAGVAFKLAWAIAQRASGSDKVAPRFREYLMDALALAALGLVADVMPLRDENRSFVRHGLLRLAAKPTVGMAALIAAAGLGESKNLRAEDIGFKLAPRINAAGRLECARLVVELLTTTNPARAKEIAEYLEDLNSKRQWIEKKATAQAREMVEANGYDREAGIVLGHADWHQGVVGIVASRLVEQYARPVLLAALKANDELSTGSGRSVPGFLLHEALNACTAELQGHGGHAAAAGFKVLPSRLDALRMKFCDYAAKHFNGEPPAPRLRLEAEVPLSALTYGLLADLEKLEPYGADNVRPRFLATGLTLEGEPKKMGKGEHHLNFRVRQGNAVIRAVGWSMAERIEELASAGGKCCLAFTPKLNEWQGQRKIEIEVVDLRPGSMPELV